MAECRFRRRKEMCWCNIRLKRKYTQLSLVYIYICIYSTLGAGCQGNNPRWKGESNLWCLVWFAHPSGSCKVLAKGRTSKTWGLKTFWKRWRGTKLWCPKPCHVSPTSSNGFELSPPSKCQENHAPAAWDSNLQILNIQLYRVVERSAAFFLGKTQKWRNPKAKPSKKLHVPSWSCGHGASQPKSSAPAIGLIRSVDGKGCLGPSNGGPTGRTRRTPIGRWSAYF